MTEVVHLNRTLEQEVLALLRGASLECLVCGEFVMHTREGIFCPECGTSLPRGEAAADAVPSPVQAG